MKVVGTTRCCSFFELLILAFRQHFLVCLCLLFIVFVLLYPAGYQCKHIRSAVIGLAHALCRDTWQARRCVVIVLVLRNSGCTTVYNKSKLTVTEAHTITLHGVRSGMPK